MKKEPRTKVLERWFAGASNPSFSIDEEGAVKEDLIALMAECGEVLDKVPHPLGGYYGEPAPGPVEEVVDAMTRILAKVIDERRAQDAKWGVQKHGPMTWLAILGEEFGEVAKAVLEGDATRYVKELVQVAAVAVATLECYARSETTLVSITELQLEVKNLRELLKVEERRGG